MAAVATPSNGSYLQHADPQHFPANATGAPPPNYQQPNSSSSPSTTNTDLPKDEVGWYFVEQYYTTLNKTPERLHLFYNKKSSFVWGTEGESLPLAHGRAEIHDRIAAHEFKDCKVRVSNVDSQGSANNGIVIQVLGEMSNNGNSNRKFSQTFFLAEQPNGYYVLNDIFRYLKDDDDIEVGDEYDYTEEAPEAEAEAEEVEQTVEETPQAEEPIPQEAAVSEAEAEIPQAEEAQEPEVAEPAEEPVNGTNGIPEVEEALEEQPEEAEAPVEAEEKPEEVAPAPVPVNEKPATPAPAPVKEPERPAPAPAPSRPKTWANIVVASTTPATPAGPITASAAVAGPPVATPAAAHAPAAAAPATPSTPTTPAGGSQWQTADSKRHSRAAPAQPQQTSAYIRNVSEAVTTQALKDCLSKYGNVKHLEVIRTKNYALADFETSSQLAAANAANPHVIAGSNVHVEERRPRGEVGGSYRGGPRGNMQGGRNDGRNPSQGGGRGGFQPRGDGQNRGRGGAGGRGGFSGGRGNFRTTTPTA